MSVTNKYNIILGIESSCDDTSAAIVKNGEILSNVVAGQDIHAKYGGVVPELASRAHQQNIVPVVDAALKQAGVTKSELTAIAYTKGPGLLGSLLVGTSFAKSMAMGLNIPLIDVNHMQGHILAHFIQKKEKHKPTPNFPFICLTVSGGHTQIVLVKDYLSMELIGETIDDAAGEAFDKAAKALGLSYPGGPLVDELSKTGDATRFAFTFPKVGELNYSFSGLKTQFLYFLQNEEKLNEKFIQQNLNDICASYQQHIVNYLFIKLKKAVANYNVKDVAIAGGVSANTCLRKTLEKTGQEEGWNIFIPEFEYCTDNAAMIAITGQYKLEKGHVSDQSTTPSARMKF